MTAAEPVWCFLCEDQPATGVLLRYETGKPLDLDPETPTMHTCKTCGERAQMKDRALRYTPALRPPQADRPKRRR